MRYSQYNEQDIILAHFGDTLGQFLDIGAHDGRLNSNTLALAERGWGGICVEPSPFVFPVLLQTHRGRKSVHCLNAAVDETVRITEFYETGGDQIGSTEIEHRDRWVRRGYKFPDTYYIQTVTPQSILDRFGGPYRFVSIDTEGSNLRVLKATPLIEMGCEMVCVEKEERGDETAVYLRKIGYTNVVQTTGNWIAYR